MSNSYEGRCHCGALAFSYSTDVPAHAWSVRACQCSFCRAHAARYTSDPNGSVRFHIAKADALVRYTFSLRTAEFLLCGACGVFLAAVLSGERGSYAAINLNALTQPLPTLPSAESVSYDAESFEERAKRRERRWAPVLGAA
jgi:hypothetical protein